MTDLLTPQDPRYKAHLMISWIGMAFCFAFALLGIWTQQFELVYYFIFFLIAFVFSLFGAIKGSPLWSRLYFVLLVGVGIFISAELFEEHSNMSMLFLLELAFVYFLLQKSPQYRNIASVVILLLFIFSISKKHLLIEPIEIPDAYFTFLHYSITISSFLSLWILLHYFAKYKPIIKDNKSDSPPLETGPIWKAVNLRMFAPLETIMASNELITEVNNSEDLNFLRHASNQAVDELNTLQNKLRTLLEKSEVQSKSQWKKVNPYQFLHRLEMRLGDWGMGGQFEFCVDESIHFREVKLPDELFYVWIGDWIKTLGPLPLGSFGNIEISFGSNRVFLKIQGAWDVHWGPNGLCFKNDSSEWLNFSWEVLKSDCSRCGIHLSGAERNEKAIFNFEIPSELQMMERRFELPNIKQKVKGSIQGISLILLQKNETLGKLNKMRLELMGADVYWVNNSDDALSIASSKKINALIVDPERLEIPLSEIYYRFKRSSLHYRNALPMFLWCEENEVAGQENLPKLNWDAIIKRPANFMDIASKLRKLCHPRE